MYIFTLSENLRTLRKEQKFSQRKLSQLSGVSNATISRIEDCLVKSTDLLTLQKLADALKISVIDLITPKSKQKISIPLPVGLDSDKYDWINDNEDSLEYLNLVKKIHNLKISASYVNDLIFKDK